MAPSPARVLNRQPVNPLTLNQRMDTALLRLQLRCRRLVRWQEAEGAGGRDSRDGRVLGEPAAAASAWGWGRRGGGSASPAPGTLAPRLHPQLTELSHQEGPSARPQAGRGWCGRGRGETKGREGAQALVVPGRWAVEAINVPVPQATPPHTWGLGAAHRGGLKIVREAPVTLGSPPTPRFTQGITRAPLGAETEQHE